mgnify:CR=1 FL=1|jgi:glutamate 5-kinase
MKFQRVVVKVGTSTLTAGTRRLSERVIVGLAGQLAELVANGAQVALVSSGAIAAGREALGFPDLPKFIPAKQMLAATGQPRLMALYERLFGIYDLRVGQILLTREDFENRRRYLSARGTLEALLDQGILPVVNENDTVATEEIRFGDNDRLSARVAALIEADLLVLLTDQEGLYLCDPRQDPQAPLVSEVPVGPIEEELWQAAGAPASGLGSGGMASKLQAADLARHAGATVVIASGHRPGVLAEVCAGQRLGTWFPPVSDRLEARKRYILAGAGISGTLHIDAGAGEALHRGGSLLPVGITALEGEFDRGDSVRVLSAQGRELALGLTHYAAADLARLLGHKSGEIETLLGYTFGDEVIHRNDMVLL